MGLAEKIEGVAFRSHGVGAYMSERNSKEELKEIMKEALKEWMDEKFQAFGKWSATGMGALVFGALVYFIMVSQGWHK